MTDQPQDYEWVILEAMGHNRVAGRYYFENGLHRVDVPDTRPDAEPDRFIRTERYGPGSIFRITTVDEDTARLVARECVIPEAIPWEARRELRQLAAPKEPVDLSFVDEEEDDDYDDGVPF